MNNFTIGFLYYLKERNIDMDYEKFAEQCENAFKTYKRKYPNGLTHKGKIINFK